jgi:hypothetical protein
VEALEIPQRLAITRTPNCFVMQFVQSKVRLPIQSTVPKDDEALK